MAKLSLHDNEVVLTKYKAMVHRKMFAYQVEVFLTNQRMLIHPINRWERFLIAKEEFVFLHHIVDVGIKGFDRYLNIQTDKKTFVLSGLDSEKLHMHLDLGLNRGEEFLQEVPLAEKVIFQTKVQIYRKFNFSSLGEVEFFMDRVNVHTVKKFMGILKPS